MPKPEWTVEGVLGSPILWGVLALVMLGISFSGKLAMTGTRTCLALAWLMSVWAIYRFPALREFSIVPRLMATMIASGAIGMALHFLSVWLEPVAAQPPISVTGFSIDPKPYEVGKTLHVNLRIKNESSGLKLKGGFKVWAGAMDEADLKPENRQAQAHEENLWKQFVANPPVQEIPLSWVRGDTISVCDGPTLTQEQADRLNGENGIVYIMGQIDYGDGALDFGGYIRTSNPQIGKFAIDHNGPAEKRFYQTKQQP